MFYTLQITAEQKKDTLACQHHPISLETFTGRKEDVTDAELDMVAEAFKAQVREILASMARV